MTHQAVIGLLLGSVLFFAMLMHILYLKRSLAHTKAWLDDARIDLREARDEKELVIAIDAGQFWAMKWICQQVLLDVARNYAVGKRLSVEVVTGSSDCDQLRKRDIEDNAEHETTLRRWRAVDILGKEGWLELALPNPPMADGQPVFVTVLPTMKLKRLFHMLLPHDPAMQLAEAVPEPQLLVAGKDQT